MSGTDYGSFHQTIIYYVLVFCSCLSTIGCGFIIFIYTTYPNVRKLPFRLIFYLTISDLGVSIAFGLPYMASNTICQIQGGLISYFPLSSVLWCGCIAHAISITVLKGYDIRQYERNYLIICYLLPLLTFLVLLDIKQYEVALGWCWIHQTKFINAEYYRQIAYRLITFYVPLLFVLIYIATRYIQVISAMRASDMLMNVDRNVSKMMILKLKLYPVILLITQLPIIVVRFMSFSMIPPWYMIIVAGSGVALSGFVNSVVYGLTQEIKQELYKNLCKRKRDELMSLVTKEEISCSRVIK